MTVTVSLRILACHILQLPKYRPLLGNEVMKPNIFHLDKITCAHLKAKRSLYLKYFILNDSLSQCSFFFATHSETIILSKSYLHLYSNVRTVVRIKYLFPTNYAHLISGGREQVLRFLNRLERVQCFNSKWFLDNLKLTTSNNHIFILYHLVCYSLLNSENNSLAEKVKPTNFQGSLSGTVIFIFILKRE